MPPRCGSDLTDAAEGDHRAIAAGATFREAQPITVTRPGQATNDEAELRELIARWTKAARRKFRIEFVQTMTPMYWGLMCRRRSYRAGWTPIWQCGRRSSRGKRAGRIRFSRRGHNCGQQRRSRPPLVAAATSVAAGRLNSTFGRQ